MRFVSMFLLVAIFLRADTIVPKCTVSSSMTLHCKQLPSDVRNFSEVLQKGVFYGRLRLNSFIFKWDEESSKRKDHYTLGVGGSLTFKSAYWYGLGFTTGIYTTQNPIHMENEDVRYYKAGKGVLSRYDVLEEDRYGMTVLAQSYLEYRKNYISVKAGRQIFESLLTKSNDTKMIPNTFEGLSFQSCFFPNTTIKAAYFTQQKLRDHSHFHHLLAYDGWRENDDAGMHRGITLVKLKERGIKDRLWIIEVGNSFHKALQWMCNLTSVPELVTLATLQGRYTFVLKNGFSLTPALRYMYQFDKGAGEIGGANLRTNTFGYKDPTSLQSRLYAAKIDLAHGAWKLRFGYSKVADKADILAPWRGFPTGGFTRAMSQYNWFANTKTYMIRGDYNFDRSGILEGVEAFFRYAIQDFDDIKSGVQADSKVLTFDIVKHFKQIPNLYAKMRVGYADGKKDIVAGDGTRKSDPSYREFRFEMNYLF